MRKLDHSRRRLVSLNTTGGREPGSRTTCCRKVAFVSSRFILDFLRPEACEWAETFGTQASIPCAKAMVGVKSKNERAFAGDRTRTRDHVSSIGIGVLGQAAGKGQSVCAANQVSPIHYPESALSRPILLRGLPLVGPTSNPVVLPRSETPPRTGHTGRVVSPSSMSGSENVSV